MKYEEMTSLEELFSIATEIIENENYDFVVSCESENDMQKATELLARKSAFICHNIEGGVKSATIRFYGDTKLKFINGRNGSTISFSDDNGTGVSRSVYYIKEPDCRTTEDEMRNVIEMINEAWFAVCG